MFRSSLNRPAERNVRNRIYCTLCMMLLAAGNVRAEDDVVDADPNSPVLGALLDLWDFLTGLVA